MPMTWGVRRPRVLLPAIGARLARPGAFAPCWRTSSAHVARADWLVHLVAQLACAVYWFHPLFWTAERALGRETELAADDEALGAGLEASQYAADMVEIVRACRRGRLVARAVVAMARAKHLERRIAALLQSSANRARVSRRLAIADRISISLAVVLPLAAITTGGAMDVDVRTVALPGAIQTFTTPGRSRRHRWCGAAGRARRVVS